MKGHRLTWGSYLIIFKKALQEPFQPVLKFNSGNSPPKENYQFDEDCFRGTLRKMKNTRSQITKFVESIKSYSGITYKIVRSIKKVLIESNGETI